MIKLKKLRLVLSLVMLSLIVSVFSVSERCYAGPVEEALRMAEIWRAEAVLMEEEACRAAAAEAGWIAAAARIRAAETRRLEAAWRAEAARKAEELRLAAEARIAAALSTPITLATSPDGVKYVSLLKEAKTYDQALVAFSYGDDYHNKGGIRWILSEISMHKNFEKRGASRFGLKGIAFWDEFERFLIQYQAAEAERIRKAEELRLAAEARIAAALSTPITLATSPDGVKYVSLLKAAETYDQALVAISHSGKYHSDGGIKWILSEIPMYKDSEKAKNPRFGVKGITFWDEFERFLIQYQAAEARIAAALSTPITLATSPDGVKYVSLLKAAETYDQALVAISHSGKYHSDGGIKWILSEIPMYKDSEKAKNPRFGVKGITFWDEFERFLIQYQAKEARRAEELRLAEEARIAAALSTPITLATSPNKKYVDLLKAAETYDQALVAISHSGKYHSDGGIKWILSEIPMYKDSEKAKNPRFGVKGIAFWDEFERFLIQYQAEEEERIRQAEEST